MKEYKIQQVRILKDRYYIPAQVVGGKFISNHTSNRTEGDKGKWVLLQIK